MVKCKLTFGKRVGGEIENDKRVKRAITTFCCMQFSQQLVLLFLLPTLVFLYILYTDDSKISKLSVPLT